MIAVLHLHHAMSKLPIRKPKIIAKHKIDDFVRKVKCNRMYVVTLGVALIAIGAGLQLMQVSNIAYVVL